MNEHCHQCPQPAVATRGTWDYCAEHLEALLTPIRDAVSERERGRDPFGGHGCQDGPIRHDWGPTHANLRCDRCDATWVGIIGEQCTWCDREHEILMRMHREVLLHPELPEPGDQRRGQAVLAWAERLGRGVRTGLVDEKTARTALDRELARSKAV